MKNTTMERKANVQMDQTHSDDHVSKGKLRIGQQQQYHRMVEVTRQQKLDGTYIKKGPWTAEEDEVLINHVQKHGPREWSSIRSNGLLPRTGKSCRLRWVNKLRPNLKTGCKFSAEEEKLVVELQAQFGNKWAKIATHLPGRTDNDVKNFWSSRRKRLERTHQKSSPSKSLRNKGKNPVNLHSLANEVLNSVVPPHSHINHEASSCSSKLTEQEALSNHNYFSDAPTQLGDPNEFKMITLPDLIKPNSISFDKNTSILEPISLNVIPTLDPLLEYPSTQLLEPKLEFPPPLPDYQDFPPEPFDPCFFDLFHQQKDSDFENSQKFNTDLTHFGLEENIQNVKQDQSEFLSNPDKFLDDLPNDMFDCFEDLPSSFEP